MVQTFDRLPATKRKASSSALKSANKKSKATKMSVDTKSEEALVTVESATSESNTGAPDDTKKLPVTILSGFLGSGKTTLLRHILSSTSHGLRIALIVNDMAEVNIDGAQVARLAKDKSKEIVQMQNGCICCTLRGDFIVELAKLAKSGKFDYLVIESSGISEPIQVAESFAFELNKKFLEISDEIGGEARGIIEGIAEQGGLSAIATIDTMVTVVDAHNFFQELQTGSFLKERFAPEDVPEDDQRTISDLFADQLEFANVIIINKLDLVNDETKNRVISLVKTFNPYAEILEATKAKVDVKKLVNTGKFDFGEAQTNPGWLRSLQEMSKVEVGEKVRLAPMPETLEYGIGSFVYTARKPFDPIKFHAFLRGKFVLFQPEVEDDDQEEEDEEEDGIKADLSGTIAKAARMDAAKDQHSDDSSDEPGDDSASDPGSSETSVNAESEGGEDEERPDDRAGIIAAKRKDPLLGGIYRMKGFLWFATRPRVMGALSAAGAILNIHGEQDWCAENIFGSCVAYNEEERDPSPIKELANVIGKACYKTPYLSASQDEKILPSGKRMSDVLHACYFTPEEIEEWAEIVLNEDDEDNDKEDQLQDIIEGKFGDIDLHFIYEVCKDLKGQWGDRRQELVFIGENVQPAAFKEKLDACLLTDAEMKDWEGIMLDQKLGADARARVKRLEKMLQRVKDDDDEKRQSLWKKIEDAKMEVGNAIEQKLAEKWEDPFAEWLTDAEKPEEEHEHEHGADHAGHDHAGHKH